MKKIIKLTEENLKEIIKDEIKEFYNNPYRDKGEIKEENITENPYSIISPDSMYIDSFYVIEDNEENNNYEYQQQVVTESIYVDNFTKYRRFDVYVNPNEGKNIKHFHIISHDDKGDEACVQIPVSKYFTHGSKTYKFNSKGCKALNELMHKDRNIGRYVITTYEYIVDTWNHLNNDNFKVEYNDITNEPFIPDYTKIADYK